MFPPVKLSRSEFHSTVVAMPRSGFCAFIIRRRRGQPLAATRYGWEHFSAANGTSGRAALPVDLASLGRRAATRGGARETIFALTAAHMHASGSSRISERPSSTRESASPEWLVLLECAKRSPNLDPVAELLQNSVDWPQLL